MLNKETFLNSALIQIFLQAKYFLILLSLFLTLVVLILVVLEEFVSLFFFFLSFFFVVVRRSIWQYSQNNQNPTKRTPPQTQKLVSLDSGQLFQGNFGVEKVFFYYEQLKIVLL